MLSPLTDLNADLADAVARGDCDTAYRELMRFVASVNALPAAVGEVLESRELDAWCQRLAELVEPGGFDGTDLPCDAQTQTYVITELYAVGGHTGVIRDFICSQPDRQHHLLLTDIHQRAQRAEVEHAFAADNVHLHWADPAASLSGRAAWLLAALRHLEQSRVFLFTHHEDAVAISAVMAAQLPRLFFYHHADHTLSLGMHLPGSTHIDLSSYSLANCRDHLSIPNCVYVPLMSPATEPRDPTSFSAAPDEPHFVTCSAGNGSKFERPYLYPYAEIVPLILGVTGGRHVHIGDLSDSYLERIREELVASGIEPARFVYTGRAPDLTEAMSEYQVSLYIGSFPIGGAKAAVDVMGSGTPIISHAHVDHPYLGTQCYVYGGAGIWQKPEELLALIRNSSPESLQEQSRLARAFWEQHYSPELLRRVLESPDLRNGPEPPALQPYRADALRSALASSSTRGDFSSLFSKIGDLERKLEKVRRGSEKTQAKLERSETRSDKAERALSTIQSSFWWKLIRPLHKLGTSAKKRFGR